MERRSLPSPFSFAVVGNGCLGSAIARELQQALKGDHRVCLICGSADRPASHLDMGRILRAADAETQPCWIAASVGAMARAASLEAASGVKFRVVSGSAVVGQPDLIRRLAGALREAGIQVGGGAAARATTLNTAGEARAALPFCGIGAGMSALVEPPSSGAGFVNPMAMIRANNVAFEAVGGTIVRGAVVDVAHGAGVAAAPLAVRTTSGRTVRAERVVVACGGLTDSVLRSCCSLPPLGYKVSKRTVVLAEVSAEQLPEFASMPTLKYERQQQQKEQQQQKQQKRWPGAAAGGSAHDKMEASSVYILPPIRYPDGHFYIKLGGGANQWLEVQPSEDPAEAEALLKEWMASDGCSDQAAELKTALSEALPSLKPASFKTKPCFTACSSATPQIQAQWQGDRIAAVGTCHGKAAGPSLQIGADVAAWLLRETSSRSSRSSSNAFEMPSGRVSASKL